MTKIKTYKDLVVWQKAHNLVLSVYRITEKYPKHELFALTSQIRRAAISVSANLVEGFRRQSIKDSINFYNMSDASLEELKYHLLLLKDLNYININEYNTIMNKAEEVGKLLTKWLQSQRKFLA